MTALTVDRSRLYRPGAGQLGTSRDPAGQGPSESVARRALGVLRDDGVRAFWFRLLGEVGYRRLLVLERPLAEPPPERPRDDEVSVAELTDPEQYRTLRPECAREEFGGRVRAGGRCFAASCGGRPVSVTWAFVGRVPVPYLRCDLCADPQTALLFDSYTAPELRGRGLSPVVADELIRAYRSRGCTRLVTCILPENRPSLRARGKMGFRPVGTLGYVGPARLRRYFYRPRRGAGT